VIGGRVMLAVAPDSARVLVEGRDVVLVTGTNGKTTTTAYVTAALRTRAIVDTNHTGANTPAGLVSTLASGSASRVVLECDEAWLPWALSQTAPRTIVFLNVSRDQLHRHHEVAALASLWRPALAGVDHVVANVDDPAVVFAALAARRQTWVAAGTGWTQDALVCPRCGDECRWSDEAWACRCGLHRPSPHWWLEGGCAVSATTRLHLDLALPGRANRVNAAMALATTAALGTSPHEAVAAMRDIGSVAGRYHVFEHKGRRARLFLAKNPAGWAEALDMIDESTAPLVLAFNAEGVDGRDPSWLYDVPFSHAARREIVVIGHRAVDMLVRLEMEGLTGLRRAPDLTTALELFPRGEVNVVANYTAFERARHELGRAC
jgi:UDP-N-acetylmuramyl tripeptide synthase